MAMKPPPRRPLTGGPAKPTARPVAKPMPKPSLSKKPLLTGGASPVAGARPGIRNRNPAAGANSGVGRLEQSRSRIKKFIP